MYAGRTFVFDVKFGVLDEVDWHGLKGVIVPHLSSSISPFISVTLTHAAMPEETSVTSLSSSSGRPSATLELQLRSGTVNLQTLTITTRNMTIGGTYRAPCAAIS
jgi:hypothetical protein